MGLAQVVNQGIHNNSQKCISQKTIDDMAPEDKEAVDNAIVLLRSGEARFSGSWLAKQINAEGHKLAISTFNKHIAKECCCEIK